MLSYFVISSIIAKKNNTISSFFGYSIAYVPTDSMEPTIDAGSMIIFEDYDYSDVEVGDIIVYYNSELSKYIIHRVYSQTDDGFIMLGDNNDGVVDTYNDGDIFYVTSENFVGLYLTTVMSFSINSYLSRTLIFSISILISLMIIFSEVFSVVKSKKKNKENSVNYDELRKEVIAEIKQEKSADKNQKNIDKKI